MLCGVVNGYFIIEDCKVSLFMIEIKKEKERVILVGSGDEYSNDADSISINPLDELKLLAETAGAEVVGYITQTRSKIEPRYYIGEGKALELKDKAKSLEATTVIFDNALSPAQISNHEKLLEVKVIDRSGLILDIFALRARTSEAKTQVELAQLKHILPRLTRQWTHLSRQVGGIGVRGPGETQLEVDRRKVRDRIARLTENLKRIEKRHIVSRNKRKITFNVTLVGYTNAGKSTLFNILSKAHAPVEDTLFKTLDTMTRLINYGTVHSILLSDTVGFIRNLPHELFASFKSTLADVKDADLLLHVIDITNPGWKEQIDVVENVLKDIDSSEIDTIKIFNKIDLIENTAFLDAVKSRYPSSVLVSGKKQTGIEYLKNSIIEASLRGEIIITKEFGSEDNELLRDIYKYGTILETTENLNSFTLTFSIPISIAKKLGFSEKHMKVNLDIT